MIGCTAAARASVPAPGFRQADVADLALAHEVGEPADGILDRHVRIDPVLIEQVDRVDPEPLERPLDRRARIGGAAVDADDLSAVEPEAELGRDHQPVALAADRLGHQFLVGERAIDLRGVEERDAQIDRRVDGRDRSPRGSTRRS